MLIVCNERQEVIAKFIVDQGPLLSRDIVITNQYARNVLESIRLADPALFSVRVCYPRVSSAFHQFNHKSKEHMDIENIVQEFEIKNHKPEKIEEAATFYVAPIANELPNDGVLNYTTIESVHDLKVVADRSVITLRDDQLDIVKCVHDYPALFKVNLVVLTGLPTAAYSVAFDETTWAYDKVAYAPFISELRVAGEIEAQLAVQNETEYDREKKQYTRKTGEVKAHTDFELATADDDSTDDVMSL